MSEYAECPYCGKNSYYTHYEYIDIGHCVQVEPAYCLECLTTEVDWRHRDRYSQFENFVYASHCEWYRVIFLRGFWKQVGKFFWMKFAPGRIQRHMYEWRRDIMDQKSRWFYESGWNPKTGSYRYLARNGAEFDSIIKSLRSRRWSRIPLRDQLEAAWAMHKVVFDSTWLESAVGSKFEPTSSVEEIAEDQISQYHDTLLNSRTRWQELRVDDIFIPCNSATSRSNVTGMIQIGVISIWGLPYKVEMDLRNPLTFMLRLIPASTVAGQISPVGFPYMPSYWGDNLISAMKKSRHIVAISQNERLSNIAKGIYSSPMEADKKFKDICRQSDVEKFRPQWIYPFVDQVDEFLFTATVAHK